MHRWEIEARALVQSLHFKDMTERELQLWNHLRMCLDDLDNLRLLESKRKEDVNNEKSPNFGYLYGDGY